MSIDSHKRVSRISGVIHLFEANLTSATLTGCKIYGISAWNLELKDADQDSLVITKEDEPVICAIS